MKMIKNTRRFCNLRRWLIRASIFASILFAPCLAHANMHPHPGSRLVAVLIPSITFALFMAGGGYLLMKKDDFAILLLRFFITAGLVLFSIGARTFYVIGLPIITGMSFWKGIKLLSYETDDKVLSTRNTSSKVLAKLRFIVFGFACMAASAYLCCAGFDMMSYTRDYRQYVGTLERLVKYQLEEGQRHKEEFGIIQYPTPLAQIPGNEHTLSFSKVRFRFYDSMSLPKMRAEFVSNEDMSSFKVFVYPNELPFYPWNKLVGGYSFYADESGAIREVEVTRPERCPEDAPIIKQVILQENKEEKAADEKTDNDI